MKFLVPASFMTYFSEVIVNSERERGEEESPGGGEKWLLTVP